MPETIEDPAAVALHALVWTLGDAQRAERLLAVTGIAPDDLRQRASEPAVLAAVLGFLENHEPDLVACAAAIHVSPVDLVAAQRKLSS